jgi:ankyrin repeat protein
VYQGYTPLHLACEAGDLRCLAALTDQGAHLFAKTATGANAAHLAVTSRRRNVLRFVCEADAEERRLLRMRDRAGRTPLELCVDEEVQYPSY